MRSIDFLAADVEQILDMKYRYFRTSTQDMARDYGMSTDDLQEAIQICIREEIANEESADFSRVLRNWVRRR